MGVCHYFSHVASVKFTDRFLKISRDEIHGLPISQGLF